MFPNTSLLWIKSSSCFWSLFVIHLHYLSILSLPLFIKLLHFAFFFLLVLHRITPSQNLASFSFFKLWNISYMQVINYQADTCIIFKNPPRSIGIKYYQYFWSPTWPYVTPTCCPIPVPWLKHDWILRLVSLCFSIWSYHIQYPSILHCLVPEFNINGIRLSVFLSFWDLSLLIYVAM